MVAGWALVAHASLFAAQASALPAEGSTTRLRPAGGVKIGALEYVPFESAPEPAVEAAVLAELPDYRSCGAAGEPSVRYLYNRTDLNGDGALETLVYLIGPETCGTGGCTMLILRSAADGLARMARLTLVQAPLVVSSSRSRGWRDLIAYVAGGGARASYHLLRYGKRGYPSNPSTAPALRSGSSISGQAYFADEAGTAAPVLRSPGCSAARPRNLGEETLGPLRIGLESARVVEALGAPSSKSTRVRSEVDALEHETWRYPERGLTLDMAFPSDGADPVVASARIGASSPWKTQRGIGIGSSYEEVESVYGGEKNSVSQPPITFVAGSGQESLVFSFEKARVTQVFLGPAGE